MRIRPAFYGLLLATTTASCAFLLDFDELQAGDGADGGGGIPLSGVVQALTDATCQRIARCRGALSSIYLGEEACTDFVKKSLEDGRLDDVERLSPDKFSYHPEQMAACIEAVSLSPCDVSFHWPTACSVAFEGKVGAGGECEHSLECPYDHICLGCPGTCTPAPKANQPCADGICGNGLYCEPESNVCRAPTSALDGACGGPTAPQCALDMFCVGADKDTAGKCKPIKALFSETNQCSWLSKFCQEGYFCAISSLDEFTNGTFNGNCTGPGQPNDACNPAFPDPCPAGYFCNGVGGFCTELPKAGEDCTVPGLKGLCVQGARCAGRDDDDPQTTPGQCWGLVRNATNCAVREQCYSNLCVNGKCKSAHSCLPPD